jgi:CDP-diacylglycerol pyrophosphatase
MPPRDTGRMSTLVTRAARPSIFSLSRYGWGQRVLLVALALIGSAAFAYAANLASRNALWQVTRVCALDRETTGSPMPCLEVNLADGRAHGYAVLRPPFGRPDTILTPTARVVGLEDPFLQGEDAPNYFALAWDARRWLAPEPASERVALAVNSRLARSQDQLHVHIGCLSPDFMDRLKGGVGPKPGVWFRGPDMAPGLEFWTYRSGKDVSALAPFRLLKSLVGDAAAMRRTTLGVAQWKGEFVVAAMRSRPGGWYAAAEDMINGGC